MEQYISKSALLAEIEKLVDKGKYHDEYDNAYRDGNNCALYALKNKLDTLEVKEVQGEAVSEDLEKASKEWLRPQLDKSYANYGEVKMMELTHFDGYAMLDAIEFGAEWQKAKYESITEDLGEYINELSKQFPEVSFAKLSRIAVRVDKWQKEQDQSTIELAEDHAMLAGMEKMKEEMMAKAVDCEVKVDAGGYPYIQQIELYDYDKDIPLAKEGDKYKVILIKEE